MNRERGASSLALVLLLLVLGSLMLQGLNQTQRRQVAMVNDETLALRNTARAHSALQWGKTISWQMAMSVQCRANSDGARACLRQLNGDAILLMAESNGIQLWQSGTRQDDGMVFSPHGWSDFCPVQEKTLCQMP
ncbi:Protein of unknown function (DUF2509) [Enterobacteriaceae bacterium strain FGI 57]|nr:Protein of unknown function (DUF2509) [Enterobacteriaceae bacterium strain FGI 57]